MANNGNPPNDALPDFDNITAHGTGLVTELSRLRNIQGLKGTQAILQAIADARAESRTQFTRIENNLRRMENTQRALSNTEAQLLPPLHPITGIAIPNCPTTLAQLHRLSGHEVLRILTELQVPVPASLPARRRALEKHFTITR